MRDTDEKQNLTVGTVWKKLIMFFVPIAVGTCIQQLYNAVDGLIVGRFVGTIALAAVGGSTSQIINLLIGFFVSMTSGASVIIAQIFGAGRREDVSKATGSAIVAFFFIGIILTAAGLLLSPWMLGLLKTPSDTMEGALLYLRIYFISVPFVLVLNMESNMLRSIGDSFHPFLYMVVGCAANIVLDFAFVVFFKWGVAGVAIATVIAQIINMILLSVRLLTTKESYRLTKDSFRIRKTYLNNMMQLGIPSGVQSSMYSISNMVIQIGVNTLGTVVVASWAMTSKIDGVFWAVSNALGASITTFVGQNIGAGRFDRINACIKQGFVIASIFTVVLSALILLLAKPILNIFTKDVSVIEMTFYMMLRFVPFYITWTITEVLAAVMRGAGDAKMPVIIIGVGTCLLRILWILFVFTRNSTVDILCFSYPISWIVTDIWLIRYFRSGNWRRIAKNRIAG